MWLEARKQEKKIRGMMVNFQRRAERRRDFYEKTRGDPIKLLRVYGNSMKIHTDSAVSVAGDSPSTMMPWSGDPDVMISRFDVRAHLDTLPSVRKEDVSETKDGLEEMQCNYECYRVLVMNAFKGISEADYLKKLQVDELHKSATKGKSKTSVPSSKAAIGYTYDSKAPGVSMPSSGDLLEEEEDSSDSECEIDINVEMFSRNDIDKVNLCALEYGITAGLFSKWLRNEKEEHFETKKQRLKELDEASTHSRRNRKERKMATEVVSSQLTKKVSPKRCTRGSPTYEDYNPEDGGNYKSYSTSSEEERFEYITTFGESRDTKEGQGSSNSIPRKSSSHNRSSSSHHSHHHASSHKSTSHRSRSKRSRSRSRSPNHHRRSKGSSHKSKYKPSSKTRDDGGYARNSNRELPSASHLSVPVKSYRRAHSSSSDELGDLDSDPSSPPPPPPPSGSSSVTSKAKGKQSTPKTNPQRRLQRVLQAQLAKQVKIDKHKKKVKQMEER